MADTALQVVVSPFLGVLFDNLTSLIQREFGLIWGVHKEMDKLSSTLSTIQDVLGDAEEKQLTNKSLRNWLAKLKDAAYEADDILDEWAFEDLQLASETRYNNSYSKKVTDSLLSCINFKQTKFHHKIGKRIKEINERFDEIAEERSKFHLREGAVEKREQRFRQTSSMLTEPEVYGRDGDKEKLVRLLLDNVKEDIYICPVVGIGGIGKTTLAQLVYNDERVAKHFEVRSWVCVSEDFDVKRLIKAIIASLSGSAVGLEELDPLQLRLQEELRGKRYLLVLDDVWNEDQDEWNKLKYSLRCSAKGSSVILTTRLGTVASITGTVGSYRLESLSEEDCWSLFKQRAFGLGSEERLSLVVIGKEIVKKCAGVPLAAKALGGLMRFKSDENEWLFVKDSQIWDLSQSTENSILPALELSYRHLPAHMRQCFAFCSIFPKGYEIEKENLIHLWMANGLIQSKGRMDLEDVGNEIFNALVWRSFFQDIRKDEDGCIETCKMHDFVHDLACHLAIDECSIVDVGKPLNVTRRTRHLSLPFSTLPSSYILESVPNSSPYLRSLISLIFRPSIQNPEFIISCHSRLRALDLKLAFVPHSIGKMIHLRYLNISFSFITILPESISELRNVQTLKLTGCDQLQNLPRDMRKMSSLRHLDIRGCFSLTTMPIGIGQLTCLHTLSFYIVGLESGRGIKELQGLNLGGDLEIKRLERVKNPMDAKDTLIKKQNLRSLWLTWSHSHWQANAAEVIEGLQPHLNVRRLFIDGYKGVAFPCWLTVSNLPNLVEVSLSMCRCEHLPALWKLPHLKLLSISSMDCLKFVDDESYGGSVVTGFPLLEEIKLLSLPNLEGWLSSEEHLGGKGPFPCLKRLTLEDCPKLIGVPSSSSLQHIKVRKCSETVLGSIRNLSSLSSLEISEFHELVYFPQEMLHNLPAMQKLQINYCNKLKALPSKLKSLNTLTWLWIGNCREVVSFPEGLRDLSYLKTISISNCHGLKCLPKLETNSLDGLYIYDCQSLTTLSDGLRYLPALRALSVVGCQELELSTEDFQPLVSLEYLALHGLPKLTSIPEGIKHSVILQYLSVKHCSDLMVIPDWIGSLVSLRVIYIHGCTSMKVLPEGLQQLTALQVLDIRVCDPDLCRRCGKNGEDWYKISRVRHVIVREWL